MKRLNKRVFLLCSLFLVCAIQSLTTHATKQSTQESVQTESKATAASKGRPAGTGPATRDLLFTLAGLLAFIVLAVFLLRRPPKDLDKYEKMYAFLESEKEKKEREGEQEIS